MEQEKSGMDENGKRMQALVAGIEGYKQRLLVCLIVALLGISTTAWLSFGFESELRSRQGTQMLLNLSTMHEEFAVSDSLTRTSNAQMRNKIEGLKLDITQTNIEALAISLYEDEKQTQLFLRLLKVHAYTLTDHVEGIHAWFERHVLEIDAVIERSRNRQLKLLQIIQFYGSKKPA